MTHMRHGLLVHPQASFVSYELEVPLSSIEDCTERGCTLCANQVQIPELEASFGNGPSYKGVGMVAGASFMQSFTDPQNACDATILSQRDWDVYFIPELCDWSFVGEHVVDEKVTQPVKSTYAIQLSYIIKQLVDTDRFEEIRRRYLIDPACSPFAVGEVQHASVREMAGGMTVQRFLGVLLVLGVGTLLSILVNIACSPWVLKALCADGSWSCCKRRWLTWYGARKPVENGQSDDVQLVKGTSCGAATCRLREASNVTLIVDHA
jgi:hypothetical protein